MSELIWISIGALAVIILMVVFVVIKRSNNRKRDDRPIPQHKFSFKPPTWRFQKFHPSSCPHHNGIYRKVNIKVLDSTIKKTIFVCSDCIDAIEIDEVEGRDKFK